MDSTIEVRSRLEQWLEKVLGYAANPPPNESTTCYWVVDPLLEALGYARNDIEPQVGDAARQYPDYTILPRTEHTWYIEAKAWGTRLADAHVAQALTYANSNGRRFVVLTNGQEWRLYDNDLRGDLQQKNVAASSIDDEEALVQMLGGLAKPSVVSGCLDSYVQRRRLRAVLRASLTDPRDPILKTLARLLVKHSPDLQPLELESLAACVSSWAHQHGLWSRSQFPTSPRHHPLRKRRHLRIWPTDEVSPPAAAHALSGLPMVQGIASIPGASSSCALSSGCPETRSCRCPFGAGREAPDGSSTTPHSTPTELL